MSNYAYFFSSLFEDGIVHVPEIGELSDSEIQTADEILVDFEKQYRLEMPLEMPPFSVPDAQNAAYCFFRACQFAVSRDAPPQLIDSEFQRLEELTDTPQTHYSVDLIFRFLPDLFRLSKSAMEEDPLVQHLHDWAVRWPLSSVNISNLQKPVQIDGFSESPGLMRLYCDRIISTGDISRLEDPRVRTLVEASWGMYPELAPNISQHFNQ
ncbi:hypothetical protein Pan241w_17480 [Gimesia alba]|uniref:MoxR-vWA-beta-propeller ternary system domain-containing protein n=1 Tax=Gimesia alba TaxID=2527973 RepID=A0A517RCS7_9PLAN|nr:hypothetical protein [Gimesia alba]QDT41685.1 hypothetical protein Pan241w_17480 [Gimesia alba]